MTYKTYLPKTHQIFCRFCKKQNRIGDNIINVFGEVHKECYDKTIIREFLNKPRENPYPKDIFTWENPSPCEFTRGRFNQHCHAIWENCMYDLKKELEGEE